MCGNTMVDIKLFNINGTELKINNVNFQTVKEKIL